jgi:hypothetical protein
MTRVKWNLLDFNSTKLFVPWPVVFLKKWKHIYARMCDPLVHLVCRNGNEEKASAFRGSLTLCAENVLKVLLV